MDIRNEQWIAETRAVCRRFQENSASVEQREEREKLREQLRQSCRERIGKIDVSEPELLIALMDAFEVTGDEMVLQQVLTLISRNIHRLLPSPENVRLLSYCYYYVMEEECAQIAKGMLVELLKGKKEEGELQEVLQTYRELVGEIEF